MVPKFFACSFIPIAERLGLVHLCHVHLFAGCPDCRRAIPVINSTLQTLADAGRDVVFVDCPVERGEYKGNPAYPYRTHPLLKIPGVPTMFRWGKTKPVGKLAGDDLESVDTILSVLCSDV